MTISSGDIKFVASRVMSDVPEGGGGPTGNVIVDGQSNAIFDDISEVDRAGGNVSMRKLFVAVQTPDTDTYLDANVIVAEPPLDPNVSITLMSTESTFDTRDQARQRIEAYLVEGPEWGGFLLENHIAGQRVIQVFQRVTERLPNIGETLVLVYNEGLSTEREQFVRVIDQSSVTRTYTGTGGRTYEAAVISLELSDPLRYDFPGTSPNEFFQRDAAKTKVRETSVADAATYCGVVPLVQEAEVGDLSAKVTSIYTQLVPSAQTEIPLVDLNAAGSSTALTPAGDATVSYTTSQPFNTTTALSLGNPVQPGTFTVAVGSNTLYDDGGQVYDGATVVGLIDYGRGTVTFGGAVAPYTGNKTVAFKVAASPLRVADTGQIPVTAESRGYNYITTVEPAPAPGSVMVSYRAQGRWYDLRDNGTGVLKGTDSAYGVGSVNYTTGSISVTLGALPDVGSAILFAWATKANFVDRSTIVVDPARAVVVLPDAPLLPGSIAIAWNDGTARLATDNGKGVIGGAATGTIDYATGELRFVPTALPLPAQEYQISRSSVSSDSQYTKSVASPNRGGDTRVTVDLGQLNVRPGTLKFSWAVTTPAPVVANVTQAAYEISGRNNARDDGNGNLIDDTGRVAGTINYTSGTLVFQPDGPVMAKVTYSTYSAQGLQYGTVTPAGYKVTSTGYAPAAVTMPASGGDFEATFQAGGSSTPQPVLAVTPGALSFDLTSGYAETIVPGSVNFTLAGKQYFDRNGQLFTDLDVVSGAATPAGTINYTTGVAALSFWLAGQPNNLALRSLLTSAGSNVVPGVTFRVPVSPVRPGTLQILATKALGGTINVTANINGEISGTGVKGTVDYQSGVVALVFGQMVTAAGRETEPWYDPANVVGGQIWEPAFVLADTLRFNAVAFSYLPLDADQLGLDPVRLPQDGRVPIFRRGAFAVVGHTKTSSPMTANNGMTYDVSRARLSRVRVIGNNGQTINAGYTVDLEAGTVTFNNVSGWSQPVRVEDRIEDLVRVSDVQISGQIAFTRPLTHDFPVGSYVASVLLAGDLRARVSLLFDQASWDSATWSDDRVGDAAVATYNDTVAPVEVANFGAITERWILRFLTTSTFQVIGQGVGVVGTFSINEDCEPNNPSTNTPYFTMRPAGFGGGWVNGNIIRMNTIGAQFPVWAIRTVQAGAETVLDDRFELTIRGDIDRP